MYTYLNMEFDSIFLSIFSVMAYKVEWGGGMGEVIFSLINT